MAGHHGRREPLVNEWELRCTPQQQTRQNDKRHPEGDGGDLLPLRTAPKKGHVCPTPDAEPMRKAAREAEQKAKATSP